MAEAALSCENLVAGWGETQVLRGISLTVPRGETLAVLGRNGVGKSTLLAALIGRATRHSGTIRLEGRPIDRIPVYDRSRLGIGYVPQEREIFPSLSVRENLLVAAHRRSGDDSWTYDRVLALFPRLRERLDHGGNQLSGGEQQMLSIGRALMGNPSVLLLDEPTEGLAPVIVEQLVAALEEMRQDSAMAVVLIEQHAALALALTKRVIVLDRGMIVYDNSDGTRDADRACISALTGIGDAAPRSPSAPS